MSEPVEPSLPSQNKPATSAAGKPALVEIAEVHAVSATSGQASNDPAVADLVAGGQAADPAQLIRIFEAALLTTQEPLSIAELKRLADAPLETKYVEQLLEQLAERYADSGVELNRVASGWRFRARPEMQVHLDRLDPQKPPRYSRAVMETLAIIAYRQPVTRGDIEEIRGVAVSSQVLKTLEARGWVESIGTRDAPGKPALYATTQQFMDDLNLRSLSELPALEEMGSLLEAGALAELPPADPEPEPEPVSASGNV